ncbi:NAD(P)/FAD-dependent oxidoreductase [Hoeflea sp. TYP-13]|uniref:NAD(P)/FAD-dependent oxidoreductase n=1 Tax=Hoeflea sp. TYP-13 TaxID=3230023 RepID=UPI0034C5B7DC
MGQSNPKIVIVGAGIIGASVAYHLARRNASVTLIDGGNPEDSATGKSFAWINAWSGTAAPYAHLRHHSLQEYRRLQHEFNGTLPLNWTGTLIWKAGAAETERRVRDQAAAGYDVRLVERDEIASLEPKLKNPPPLAAFTVGEGSIEPVEATQMLLQAARQAGAEILRPARADALAVKGDRITGVRIAGKTINADVVVLAAGIGTGTLAASVGAGVPVDASPAVLARFRTSEPLVNTVIINPDMEVRQISPNTMAAAANYIDASGENGPHAVAERILLQIRSEFTGAHSVALDSVEVGWRPIPADGLPVAGFAPQVKGLYLTVMHSGITLAPAIGRFSAAEILDDIEVRLLDICRPGRFGD